MCWKIWNSCDFFTLYIICMHIYNYLRTYRFHFYYTDICIYIYFITTNYSDHEFWRRKNLYLYYGCTCFMLWRNSLKVLLWLRAGSINWRAINTIYRNFTRGICVILYSKKIPNIYSIYIVFDHLFERYAKIGKELC